MKMFLALMAFALAACTTPYQPGNVTNMVTQYQLQYCATADPYSRAVALAMLTRLGAELPDSGVCTDLAEAVLAGRLTGVDTEQAEADREWARRVLEGE